MPHLIAFSGLPGVGKTTVARQLSRRVSAVYVRVDEIETALKNSGLKIDEPGDAGYLAAAAIAASNLRLGHDMIADTVNPVGESRSLWAVTARDAGAVLLNVELVCSDEDEHRRRVATRSADIGGHVLPDWQEVQQHTYEPWTEPCLRIDTALASAEDAVQTVLRALQTPVETP